MIRKTVSASLFALALLPAAASAQSAEDFYNGKRLTLIVGYAPGGGYDTYARMAAPHFARNLAGKPTIIVQNMPGADSLTALNHLSNRASRDGSVIATFSRTLAISPLLGQLSKDKAQYDPQKLYWIGSFNNEVSVIAVWAASGVRSVDDLKSREVLVGATGLTSSNAVYPYVANNVIGTKFKVITGYPGTSHMTLAMERGEIHGNGGWSLSSIFAQHPAWLKEKKLNILMQLSTSKHPSLPDVPLILDFAKNQTERKALELVFAPLALGRPLAAPPGVPADRGAALRAAFDATVKDKAFLAAADKAKLDITPIGGTDIQQLIANMYSATPEVVDLAKKVVQRGTTAVGKAVIPYEKVTAKISRVDNGGREIRFTAGGKKAKAAISGSGTNVTINGQKAKRSAITPGMTCVVDYQGSGSTARGIDCK
jgi:tripartite-type tricarboxylate transporter receptor subunit TctC